MQKCNVHLINENQFKNTVYLNNPSSLTTTSFINSSFFNIAIPELIVEGAVTLFGCPMLPAFRHVDGACLYMV